MSPLTGSLPWGGSVSRGHDFRPGRKPPPFLPPRHAKLRRTVWVCLCVFVWGGRFEGRLPGAPRPRRGREPADRHGGVFSDFPLETSSFPSGTLDTSRVPTEGHVHALCPHSVPGVKPSRRALSQPSESGECPGPPAGRVPRLRPLWPWSRRESRLAGSAGGRQP